MCWDDDVLAGIDALKQRDPDDGELKSMRTSPDRLRRGVGRTMLDHLIAEARARDYGRVSLETGSTAAYAPARSLYESAGFVACAPFGTYEDTAFSRYYTLEL